MVSPTARGLNPSKMENNGKVKVPVQAESKVVEVSLRHVILGVVVVFSGVFITTTGIILIKEQARFRRQQSMLDSALQLVTALNRKENDGKR